MSTRERGLDKAGTDTAEAQGIEILNSVVGAEAGLSVDTFSETGCEGIYNDSNLLTGPRP